MSNSTAMSGMGGSGMSGMGGMGSGMTQMPGMTGMTGMPDMGGMMKVCMRTPPILMIYYFYCFPTHKPQSPVCTET